jgi:hypothetical protein
MYSLPYVDQVAPSASDLDDGTDAAKGFDDDENSEGDD